MGNEADSKLPNIGYLYHYPSLDHPTDKFRLDVYISSIPTEKHFDVLHVILNVESQYGGLERLKISHPWKLQSPYRVCPGMVILEDRKDKKYEAFCFGGQLTINVKDMLTECILLSSAPILEIDENLPMKVKFIEKVEILLAEYRADYSNDKDYEFHLCAAAPFDIYSACLKNILDEVKSKTHQDDINLQFLDYLHKEEYRLSTAGLLKDTVPSLDEIFVK